MLEQKKRLVKTFENTFNVKIDEVITREGLEYIWDDKTSFLQVASLLDNAVIRIKLERILTNIVEDIKTSRSNVKELSHFEVERTKEQHYYPDKFESKEDAYEFIKKECMTTVFTIDDFRVVKVYD